MSGAGLWKIINLIAILEYLADQTPLKEDLLLMAMPRHGVFYTQWYYGDDYFYHIVDVCEMMPVEHSDDSEYSDDEEPEYVQECISHATLWEINKRTGKVDSVTKSPTEGMTPYAATSYERTGKCATIVSLSEINDRGGMNLNISKHDESTQIGYSRTSSSMHVDFWRQFKRGTDEAYLEITFVGNNWRL